MHKVVLVHLSCSEREHQETDSASRPVMGGAPGIVGLLGPEPGGRRMQISMAREELSVHEVLLTI